MTAHDQNLTWAWSAAAGQNQTGYENNTTDNILKDKYSGTLIGH